MHGNHQFKWERKISTFGNNGAKKLRFSYICSVCIEEKWSKMVEIRFNVNGGEKKSISPISIIELSADKYLPELAQKNNGNGNKKRNFKGISKAKEIIKNITKKTRLDAKIGNTEKRNYAAEINHLFLQKKPAIYDRFSECMKQISNAKEKPSMEEKPTTEDKKDKEKKKKSPEKNQENKELETEKQKNDTQSNKCDEWVKKEIEEIEELDMLPKKKPKKPKKKKKPRPKKPQKPPINIDTVFFKLQTIRRNKKTFYVLIGYMPDGKAKDYSAEYHLEWPYVIAEKDEAAWEIIRVTLMPNAANENKLETIFAKVKPAAYHYSFVYSDGTLNNFNPNKKLLPGLKELTAKENQLLDALLLQKLTEFADKIKLNASSLVENSSPKIKNLEFSAEYLSAKILTHFITKIIEAISALQKIKTPSLNENNATSSPNTNSKAKPWFFMLQECPGKQKEALMLFLLMFDIIGPLCNIKFNKFIYACKNESAEKQLEFVEMIMQFRGIETAINYTNKLHEGECNKDEERCVECDKAITNFLDPKANSQGKKNLITNNCTNALCLIPRPTPRGGFFDIDDVTETKKSEHVEDTKKKQENEKEKKKKEKAEVIKGARIKTIKRIGQLYKFFFSTIFPFNEYAATCLNLYKDWYQHISYDHSLRNVLRRMYNDPCAYEHIIDKVFRSIVKTEKPKKSTLFTDNKPADNEPESNNPETWHYNRKSFLQTNPGT